MELEWKLEIIFRMEIPLVVMQTDRRREECKSDGVVIVNCPKSDNISNLPDLSVVMSILLRRCPH
jgi:hypothetical protein